MKSYEAMFLFDPTFGSTFEKCEAEVRRLIDRAEGQILQCRKWDERRLAYRINGRSRGVYVLAYFTGQPDKVAQLERDAKLSENILRVLVLRAEGLTEEAMEKAFQIRTEDSDRVSYRDRDSSDDSSGSDDGQEGAAGAVAAGGGRRSASTDEAD